MISQHLTINNRSYSIPKTKTIVVCLDGISPDYLYSAVNSNSAPTLACFLENGFFCEANGVIPSYTIPNNLSIVTGCPPSIHGISSSGLIYSEKAKKYDTVSAYNFQECDSILTEFSKNGIATATITAKDKLLFFLDRNRSNINISAEAAHRCHGNSIEKKLQNYSSEGAQKKILCDIDSDWMYSEKPSLFALDLAIALLEGKGAYVPQMLYVTLTDYVPHKHAPESSEAIAYLAKIDERLAELNKKKCIIGVTADHGMNSKYQTNKSPKAIWIDDVLSQNNIVNFKTVLPITDKYLGHHSGLGSCAWIHLSDHSKLSRICNIFEELNGIDEALTNEKACLRYNLSPQSIGDVFLLSDKNTVLGSSFRRQDDLPDNLRSHGGLHEQTVPFIINRKLKSEYFARSANEIRNFDVFEYVLNGVSDA